MNIYIHMCIMPHEPKYVVPLSIICTRHFYSNLAVCHGLLGGLN